MERSKIFLTLMIICFIITASIAIWFLANDYNSSVNSLLAIILLFAGLGEIVFGWLAVIEALGEI